MGVEHVEGDDRSCGDKCHQKRRSGIVAGDDSECDWPQRDERRVWIRNPEGLNQKAS